MRALDVQIYGLFAANSTLLSELIVSKKKSAVKKVRRKESAPLKSMKPTRRKA